MEEKYPELEDIKQAIKKYVALNPEITVVFGAFVLKDSDEPCEDCGECDCKEVNYDRSHLGAVGQLDNLRFMLNNLRDLVEDSCDRREWINNL